MANMKRMVLVLTDLFLPLVLTQRIFQIRLFMSIGLRRPMLTVVAVRGMSASATAILTSTISTVIILFGWCVSERDTGLSFDNLLFCLALSNHSSHI